MITRYLFPLLAVTLALSLSTCTEPNPDYDPDFVPQCKTGDVKCSEDMSSILACTAQGDDDPVFVAERTCWTDTTCSDGYCGADNEAACQVQADCEAGKVCTALPSSRDTHDNFCITSPYPTTQDAGKACSNHTQCKSGYCSRHTCFTPCNDINDCPINTSCVQLSVTIDGIQDVIDGCAIDK